MGEWGSGVWGNGEWGNGAWGTHLGLHLLYVLVKQLVSNLLNGDCGRMVEKTLREEVAEDVSTYAVEKEERREMRERGSPHSSPCSPLSSR